jgi:hypothetical protein
MENKTIKSYPQPKWPKISEEFTFKSIMADCKLILDILELMDKEAKAMKEEINGK